MALLYHEKLATGNWKFRFEIGYWKMEIGYGS